MSDKGRNFLVSEIPRIAPSASGWNGFGLLAFSKGFVSTLVLRFPDFLCWLSESHLLIFGFSPSGVFPILSDFFAEVFCGISL